LIPGTAYEVKETEKKTSVYKCLAYFDIFNYPLTITEISDFCEQSLSEKELHQSLAYLLENHKIKRKHDYYFLYDSKEDIIQERISNQANALLKHASVKKYSRLIARFPFVKGVCISGSFSKGILTQEGDIDYFIITAPNRLWICRSLLILYKKTILLNSRKNFCLNYFIDSKNLEIPDKNTFVATEIKTLLPTYNQTLFKRFLNDNAWANEFLPNREGVNLTFCDDSIKKPFMSRLTEFVLSTKPGDLFDSFFFRLTLKRWQQKFPEFSMEDFDLNMRTRRNVSKHHPRGFQKKVLQALSERMNAYQFQS
jgi:hypothetical protein